MRSILLTTLGVGAVGLSLLTSRPGAAQERKQQPPAACTGLQMDMATGVSFPMGKATGATGDDLGARYSAQVPMTLGLGGKPGPHLYVGAYLGLGLGWEGSDERVEAACDDNDADLNNDIACSAISYRAGVELRYSFAPAARWNPWLGYGMGLTGASQTIHDRTRGRRETTLVRGWEVARLSLGLDARPGRVAGLGPFLTVAVGRFDHTRTSVGATTTYDGPLEDHALHAWLTIGARLVWFP